MRVLVNGVRCSYRSAIQSQRKVDEGSLQSLCTGSQHTFDQARCKSALEPCFCLSPVACCRLEGRQGRQWSVLVGGTEHRQVLGAGGQQQLLQLQRVVVTKPPTVAARSAALRSRAVLSCNQVTHTHSVLAFKVCRQACKWLHE